MTLLVHLACRCGATKSDSYRSEFCAIHYHFLIDCNEEFTAGDGILKIRRDVSVSEYREERR